MKKSQTQRIINKLLHDGFITRNECLKNYISRLGARIDDLKNEGWEFDTEFIKTATGTDYKYTVKKSPFTKVEYRVNGMDKTIIKYEKNPIKV